MKRFFQPAVPDPSKRAKGSGDDPTALGGTAGCAGERRSDPRSFVTWNANSLLGRLRKQPDKDALFQYLREKDLPDVICVQETWLPAAAPNRYVLAPPPSGPVPTFITTSSPRIIRRSDPSRRLPLTRRGTLKDDTKAAREDAALIHLCLRQKPLSAYRPYWSCADAKRAGTAVLVKKDVDVISVRRSLTGGTSGGDGEVSAHDEGRVLLLEFGTFVLLNMYAQNNGWTEESFAKRRRWDAELAAFVNGDATGATRRPRFDPTSDSDSPGTSRRFKPLMWTGDLNVCHREIDVTHPQFFATQKPEGRKGKPAPAPPADPGDVGQPGFTRNERTRFERLVTAHNLVDAYRRCVGDVKDAMTWMGHPGVVSVGKYRGMGMRLDYFMLEPELADRVDACEQATDGMGLAAMSERPASAFFGSDHCAVYLRLKDVPGSGKSDGEGATTTTTI